MAGAHREGADPCDHVLQRTERLCADIKQGPAPRRGLFQQVLDDPWSPGSAPTSSPKALREQAAD